MKYIITTADKNETGVAFDDIFDFVEELAARAEDAADAGATVFVVEVDTDAGESSLNRDKDVGVEAKDEDESEIGSER